MKLRFVKKQQETTTCYTFFFEPEERFDFVPGQYLHWKLPHTDTDDRKDDRWFTISSSPTEDFITITTRLFDKPSSFKLALASLEPGAKVEAEGPEGDFVLDIPDSTTAVFVAGGIGITPYRSILKDMFDRGVKRPVLLLYANKTASDIPFKDELAEFQAKNHQLEVRYVIEQDAPAAMESGQLTAERIRKECEGLTDRVIYLSGPEPMVEALEKGLKELGETEDTLRTDFFPGYESI